MERSHTFYAVTLRRLLLSAPLLIALSAPLAAYTQAQKTDAPLQQTAKAVDAITQGPGAARGGIYSDVTGGPIGLAIAGQGGYILAQAGGGQNNQQQGQLTPAEQQKLTAQQQQKQKEKDKEKEDKDKKPKSPKK